jgi:hypothetical protein
MSKTVKRVALVLGVALVGAQAIRVDRSNPPVETEVAAPPAAQAVLERSCYDCHSNKTVWPWYSQVAPASWLVARDVHEGRHHLNFSTWNQFTTEKQQKAVRAIWKQVSEGEMPMSIYLPLHPSARLSDADKAALKSWAETMPPAPPGSSDELHEHDDHDRDESGK